MQTKTILRLYRAICLLPYLADACSSRSTPKPRPPNPTLRPNITIETFICPEEYEKHYCLNNAKCFVVNIGNTMLYNCECAEGFMGQRCEFKDLDGSYLPSKQRAMLEQAGLTSTAAICVVLVVIVCFYLYVRSRRKSENSERNSNSRDVPDGVEYNDYENERLPFSSYYYHSPTSPKLSPTGHQSFNGTANRIQQPPMLSHPEKDHKSSGNGRAAEQPQIVSSSTALISPPVHHLKTNEQPSLGHSTS